MKSNNLWRLLVSFLLIITLSFQGKSEGSYVLEDKSYKVLDPQLTSFFTWYRDTSGTLKVEDLRKVKFRSYDEYTREAFDPSSTYWFRLPVLASSQQYNLWFLEVLDPNLDQLSVTVINGDTIRYGHTGISQQFVTRAFSHKNYVFPLKVSYGDKPEIYLSYKDEIKSRFRLSLRPAIQFSEYALSEYYFLGIFYGILLIMALYNLFVFIHTREKIYIYYVLYVFCFSLHAFRTDGLGYQYLWPELPGISQVLEVISTILLVLSFTLYSVNFLSVKKHFPSFYRYLPASAVLYAVLFITNSFFFKVVLLDFFYMLPFALLFIISVCIAKKERVVAFYFILAFSFLLVTFTIFVLRFYHIIPTTIYSVYALNFGFLAEVVIFSYGMGQRLRIEKEKQEKIDKLLILQLLENEKLKDALNKDLEDKVAERTRELQEKNSEMKELLEELEARNERIEELNKLLETDNKELSQNIKDINKARFMLKDLSLEEFQKIYPDEDACFKYLAELKWTRGYRCRKCNNEQFYPGKTLFSRRCSSCAYDESATAFTFFHNSKMPVTTSFYLVYMVLANKEISSHVLGQKLGLRQKTCWAYKKRILEEIDRKGSSKIDTKDWGKVFFNA